MANLSFFISLSFFPLFIALSHISSLSLFSCLFLMHTHDVAFLKHRKNFTQKRLRLVGWMHEAKNKWKKHLSRKKFDASLRNSQISSSIEMEIKMEDK